ncbi:MAG TPA: hypothetical protein VII28_11310 [Puia sp.]
MKTFTYQYQGETFQSAVEYYMEGRDHRYRVQLGESFSVIVPSGFPGPNHSIVWVQSHKGNETVLDHELVQAIGEGVERSGMPIQKVSSAF